MVRLSAKRLGELSSDEIEKLIDQWVHNARDRRMLKRRLLDGVIYEDLAYEFNLSVRYTKKVIYKNEERLFKHIK